MSQALIYTLLGLALVLPLVGAAALRVFFGRLSEWQVALVATLVFGTAIASVLVLARSNADSLRIGGLTLLLPVTAPNVDDLPLIPTEIITGTVAPVITATSSLSNTGAITPTNVLTNASATPLASPTVVTPTATLTPTLAVTSTATTLPTATITPTAVLTSTATSEPPPPPTDTPQPALPAPRTYTVQNGDTLRSIATQFNVSVADLLRANNLTAAQADSLRPGQVLTIP